MVLIRLSTHEILGCILLLFVEVFFFFLFTDLHIAIVPLPYTLELIPIPATQGVKNMSVGKKKVKWWIAL